MERFQLIWLRIVSVVIIFWGDSWIPRVFRNRKECLDNDDFVILGKNVILNRVSCWFTRFNLFDVTR